MADDKNVTGTVVGEVMKEGGGAAVGAATGGLVVGPLIGVALAPFTGGLSIPIAGAITFGSALLGGVIGHKVANKTPQ
jgi:hypothetical protein